jgi:teichuronic acid biosynthesis glycosyltransferase TuaC
MYPTSERPWFGSFVAAQIDDLRALGVKMHVHSFDGTADRLNYLRAARDLRSLVGSRGFDLVHAHYGLTGAVAVSQRTLPVVTTFHGGDYTGQAPWQAAVSWLVCRLSTPIFVSAEGTRRLRRPGAAVIPAAVDTDLFQPRHRSEARKQLGWDEGVRYALMPAARALRNKRADLFEASVRRAQVDVPDLRPVFLEGYSRTEVANVMNAVDVTVMTSDYEGSPVAIRESLACLTPVVSVSVGDVPELLAGLPGCAVVERSERLLADAIAAALDAGRPPELRERALEFSRRRMAERVIRVYERLLGEAAG